MLLLALACAGSPDDTAAAADSAPLPAPELKFRYVVIGDPHVSDPTGDARDRLDRAVAWINAEASARDLRLAIVVGDIAWDDGVEPALASLDALTIPWVPINGDNEVHLGAEESYSVAFEPQYDALASTFEDWEKAPTQVDNPEWGVPSWFHNMAFTYEGIRFVGIDWASRDPNALLGEFGELHDFPGGSFPFFEEQITRSSVGNTENVVIFTHIPMHFGAFDVDEMDRIKAVTAPLGEHVWADLAGHYHASASETVEDAGYDLHVTDATWDDEIELRLVEVWVAGDAFAPITELVVVPR